MYLVGNCASISAASATSLCFLYPIDLVRIRLAADVGGSVNREFTGIADCVYKISKTGLQNFYKGFCISIFRIIAYRSS